MSDLSDFLREEYSTSLEKTKKLYELFIERSQLYGSIIYLMKMYEIAEFEVSVDDFNAINQEWNAKFTPIGDGTRLMVSLERIKNA